MSSLANKLVRSAGLVTLHPFDVTTEAGRANERHRRILLTAIASVLAKVVSIATAVVMVPLTYSYLGAERYGMWMTISSVILMLSFADLGLGNGLLTGLSEANGRDDRHLASQYVSSTFFMLLALAVFLAMCLGVVYPLIPWHRIFNVTSSSAVAESGPAMVAFIACFLINMPLGIVNRIQLGYQEGFGNSIWLVLGNLLGLGGVLLVVFFKGSLFWLVLAMAGAPTIATALNGIVVFAIRRPWLLPDWGLVDRTTVSKVFHLGVLFFVLQLAVSLTWASDNVVIAQALGATAVSDYSIPARLFSFPPMILAMLLGPLWPAYGEAVARGDIGWAKKTLLRTLVISVVFTAMAAAPLVLMGRWVLAVWIGASVSPSTPLLLSMGIQMITMSVGSTFAMFLNGANIVRFQVVSAICMAVSAMTLKIVLTHSLGLPGIVWATIIAHTVCSLLPCCFLVPGIFGKMMARRKPALAVPVDT